MLKFAGYEDFTLFCPASRPVFPCPEQDRVKKNFPLCPVQDRAGSRAGQS